MKHIPVLNPSPDKGVPNLDKGKLVRKIYFVMFKSIKSP